MGHARLGVESVLPVDLTQPEVFPFVAPPEPIQALLEHVHNRAAPARHNIQALHDGRD